MQPSRWDGRWACCSPLEGRRTLVFFRRASASRPSPVRARTRLCSLCTARTTGPSPRMASSLAAAQLKTAGFEVELDIEPAVGHTISSAVAQKALAFPEDFRPRMEAVDQHGGFHSMSDQQTSDSQARPRKTISFTSTTNTSGQVGHQQRWTKWFMPGQLGARPVPTKKVRGWWHPPLDELRDARRNAKSRDRRKQRVSEGASPTE